MSADEWRSLAWYQCWLVMTRAAVLLLTFNSVLVGVLMAGVTVELDVARVSALMAGLLLAHAANNLINDWTDYRLGIDQENEFRRSYGSHVLVEGFVSEKKFLLVTLLTSIPAIACGTFLVLAAGSYVLHLAAAGAVFVLFYSWPLKHYALGEVSVFLVWGPLMTSGSFYVLTGTVTTEMLLISMLAGFGPTLLIFGKHMDKAAADSELGVRTLPVVIGQAASAQLCRGLLGTQWLVLLYLLFFHQAWYLVGTVVSLPAAWRLLKQLGTRRPLECPAAYPADIWPLWFSAPAFRYAASFGLALPAGLAVYNLAP